MENDSSSVAWSIKLFVMSPPKPRRRSCWREIFYIYNNFGHLAAQPQKKGSKHNETQTGEYLPLFGERINNIKKYIFIDLDNVLLRKASSKMKKISFNFMERDIS
jgi:hypothetical protein